MKKLFRVRYVVDVVTYSENEEVALIDAAGIDYDLVLDMARAGSCVELTSERDLPTDWTTDLIPHNEDDIMCPTIGELLKVSTS